MTVSELLADRGLSAVFQPMMSMATGEVFGYEGLMRGPARTPLHSPDNLLRAARMEGCGPALEIAARTAIALRFRDLGLSGLLFVNTSPDVLADEAARRGSAPPAGLDGLPPERVVLELTEGSQVADFDRLLRALARYRNLGYAVAIDDLGEGFASLKLWSELKPDYVKIDRHFVSGIQLDPLKHQFAQAIQQISDSVGTRVVAEGVETEAELRVVRDLGIPFAQGFLIARPAARPAHRAPGPITQLLGQRAIAVYPDAKLAGPRSATAIKLLCPVAPTDATSTNEAVFARFEADPELESLPVVDGTRPVGLINRHRFFDRFARQYQRELFGRRPCTMFMDASPLIVDSAMNLQTLGLHVVDAERRHLADGFILVTDGRYAGLGTGHDLMREITQMQIAAARYANPLTMLPGNVPIAEHMERLLAAGAGFAACYADLDNFKPLNDVFGYRKGDEVIQLVARILSMTCEPQRDFLGHIGGDDFMLLMQSEDWEERCEQAIASFGEQLPELLDAQTRADGGFTAEDRRGAVLFFAPPSLSIGAVIVPADTAATSLEIAAAATDAKKLAKRIDGNSLFVERRRLGA